MISYPIPYYKRPRRRGVFDARQSSLAFRHAAAQARLCAALLLRLDLGHHFADEIILFLLDAGAYFVTHELHDRGAGLLEELLDRDVRILDERLPYQSDFRQILAQPALDHFGDDLRRLFLGLGLLRQNLALLIEHGGR